MHNIYIIFFCRFPIGYASSCRFKGLLYWLSKKEAKSISEFKKANVAAIKYSMKLEQARSHYDYGRFTEPTKSRRLKHLNKALKIFEDQGCLNYVEVCKIEIEVNNKTQAESADHALRKKIDNKSWMETKTNIALPAIKLNTRGIASSPSSKGMLLRRGSPFTHSSSITRSTEL